MKYAEIYAAWLAFRRGKKRTPDISRFEFDLERNLAKLLSEINTRCYCHGAYRQVVIHDNKRRDLSVAAVRDRVVHRLVYDYLFNLVSSGFDYDVWLGQISKGLKGCLERTQRFLRKYPGAFVWRLDIKKFFDNVDHEIMLKLLGSLGISEEMLFLAREIIASHSNGIPIGNLSSQIFANIYLNELDQFLRHKIKPLAFVRYGDDVIVFFGSKAQLEMARLKINSFVDNLKLTINPRNDWSGRAYQGLKFLGHSVTVGKIVIEKPNLENLNWHNLASFKALFLDPQIRQNLDLLFFDFWCIL